MLFKLEERFANQVLERNNSDALRAPLLGAISCVRSMRSGSLCFCLWFCQGEVVGGLDRWGRRSRAVLVHYCLAVTVPVR